MFFHMHTVKQAVVVSSFWAGVASQLRLNDSADGHCLPLLVEIKVLASERLDYKLVLPAPGSLHTT